MSVSLLKVSGIALIMICLLPGLGVGQELSWEDIFEQDGVDISGASWELEMAVIVGDSLFKTIPRGGIEHPGEGTSVGYRFSHVPTEGSSGEVQIFRPRLRVGAEMVMTEPQLAIPNGQSLDWTVPWQSEWVGGPMNLSLDSMVWRNDSGYSEHMDPFDWAFGFPEVRFPYRVDQVIQDSSRWKLTLLDSTGRPVEVLDGQQGLHLDILLTPAYAHSGRWRAGYLEVMRRNCTIERFDYLQETNVTFPYSIQEIDTISSSYLRVQISIRDLEYQTEQGNWIPLSPARPHWHFWTLYIPPQ
ncbi:hypothetical protein [Pontibacter sp. G13]|uniref:hypothetical protein n=1 Tax=Pontibacter sp. G13 TaxID=3074898 RepID=UPI00288C128D|nr:hypothetical protein [Pontibacter sp. G13]WNJ19505.1 hypothetical protein RJD25_03340 [Pontibacter sp. G13]